jgi:hypothetical protein
MSSLRTLGRLTLIYITQSVPANVHETIPAFLSNLLTLLENWMDETEYTSRHSGFQADFFPATLVDAACSKYKQDFTQNLTVEIRTPLIERLDKLKGRIKEGL